MRGKLWLSSGVAVAILVVVGVVVINRKEAVDTAPACKLASPSMGDPVDDIAGVEVADQGFTQIGSLAVSNVSIGAVLKNSTGRVAYRTRVTFDLLDAAGRSVLDDADRRKTVLDVPVILPGAAIPVGTTVGPKSLTRVASVTIKPVVSKWLRAGGPATGLGSIEAVVDTGMTNRYGKGGGGIYYETHTSNCVDLVSRGMAFVLRDASARIVGGGSNGSPQLTDCSMNENRLQSVVSAAPLGVPEAAVMSKTEVYPLCDLEQRPVFTGSEAVVPLN